MNEIYLVSKNGDDMKIKMITPIVFKYLSSLSFFISLSYDVTHAHKLKYNF